MSTTPTGGWSDQAQVDWFLGRSRSPSPRDEGERLLVDVIPGSAHSVLDLGCGDGRLTHLIMTSRPAIERAVALDRSAPMLAAAHERLASRDRVIVLNRDLMDDVTDLGSFDVVVSGLAIHHLPDERKRSLYHEIASVLSPGGVLVNLDIVTSATPALHAEFLRAIGRDTDDPEDRLTPLSVQLGWLREAGLGDVDCVWQWRAFALMAGVKHRT